MLHFGMNMPYYLMMIYGSIMIVMVFILRMLFRNRLPKFVFPVLWVVVLLRFVIPFSVSSPLSLRLPWNILSPLGIVYSSSEAVTAVAGDSYLPDAAAPAMEDDSSIPGTAALVMEDVPLMPDRVTAVTDTSVLKGTAGSNIVEVDNNAAVTEVTYHDVYFDNYSSGGHVLYDSFSDKYASIGGFLNSFIDEYAYVGTEYYDYFYVLRILLVVYLLGFITVAGILGLQKYRYLKRLRGGLLIEHNETVNTILRDMGMGHVLVFTSDEIASPMVCGLLSPRIYLPTQMEFQNTTLLRHVLSHETMHIRRKDNWLKCMMLIVLCLNWFNPLVWLMAVCFASDLEAACDAAVLKQCDEDTRKEYAFSLLAMAVSASRTSLLYSAFSKTEVEKRVKNVLSYKKMTFLALLFTILLIAGSMTAFASIGQAPFWSDLTAFCSSDISRWGVDVSITRDIALGKNAQERAEDVVFSVLRTDETGDPDVIKDRILAGLAKEFGVERGAFHVETSFIISDELLMEDYEAYGLSAAGGNASWTYQGEKLRTYTDEMIGRYYSKEDGTVDVYVRRDKRGEITSVDVFHEGDPEYDERTRKYYGGKKDTVSKSSNIYVLQNISYRLKDISMLDQDKGWALTKDNELLFTDKGVENFVPVRKFDGVNKANDDFMDICAVDEQNVYTVYFSEEGNLTVEFTKDGGKSWKRTLVEWIDDSEDGYFEAWGSAYVSFTDEENGYVLYCSSPAAGLMKKELFYTTDAGESFSYAGELSEISGYPQGFTVSGGKSYIAVSPRGEAHYLYIQEESADIWKSEEIIVLPGGIRYFDGLTPVFDIEEERNGMIVLKAVGDTVNYLLLVTEDGGEGWTQIGEIPLDSVRSYSCIGVNQFYLVDDSGNLFKYSRP